MNRPELVEALLSVEKQTYPNIEIVLVDATGKGLDQHASLTLKTPVVDVQGGAPWNRPCAANHALQHASGGYLMFLDEDDWISADHVQSLMSEFQKHPEAVVVYSGTQCTDQQGNPLDRIISVPFDPDQLKRDNFIPIHAALFTAGLRDKGCQFDTSLDIYEDWDFWLQCAQFGTFVHLDRISAWYRLGGTSATDVSDETLRYQAGHPIALAREKIFEKWRLRWNGGDINRLLGAMDQSQLVREIHQELSSVSATLLARNVELAECHELMRDRDNQLNALQQSHQQLLQDHQQLQQSHQQLLQDHQMLNKAHRDLDQQLRMILSSFSWRAMGPYRRSRRILDARLVNPLKSLLAARKTLPLNMTAAHNPLRCEIMIPGSEGHACTQYFTLQAWAWSPETLEKIHVLLDGTPYTQIAADYLQASTGQTQASEEDARQTGFATLIDASALEPGPHVLSVVARDKAGHSHTATRNFTLFDSRTLYQFWRNRPASNSGTGLTHSQENVQILLLVCNATQDIHGTIASLLAQSHVHWHCEVLCAAELNEESVKIIHTLVDSHNPRQFSRSEKPVHSAVQWSKGNACSLFLDAGDILSTQALQSLLGVMQEDTILAYSDHDERNADGRLCNPWFTWQWSPELLLNQNYIGGVYLLRGEALPSEINTQDPAWRYSLLLHACRNLQLSPTKTRRVPEILWTSGAADPQQAPLIALAEQQAVQKIFPQVQVSATAYLGVRQVQWPLKGEPRVSIIIPTTGKMRYLQPCLGTLKEKTLYKNFEVIVLDNSRGKNPDGIAYARTNDCIVLDCDEDFNWSRLNNIGVNASTGELLLFLNDDIEFIDEHWLHEMVRLALLEDVGTVGCLLLYPNGAIQHGGVFLVDHGGGARHLFHRQLPGLGVYQHLDACAREVSANTGACLMIARDKFEALGRFDEALALVGNDIDLCLRSLVAGYRNVWTPHSRLVHHESVSRKDKPIGKDEKTMWSRWKQHFMGGDPSFNPSLSLAREDCMLKLPENSHFANLPATSSATVSNPQFGVNLIAYIRAEMGVGEAARGNAAALEASGVPFGIINYEKANPSRMSNLAWQRKEIQSPQFDINLLHINADHTPAVMRDLGEACFKSRYNIGFWAWELSEFPSRWCEVFELLDEIWVPSTFVNEAISGKSPIPVVTIPHAVSIAGNMIAPLTRASLGIPDDAFVFLSMFDTHSIAQRKNPYGSIVAFQKAFGPHDSSACLVIKVNNADQDALAMLADFIGEHRNILVIHRPFDRGEINGLLALIDCYVSLHHAEGFGLGPAEAMALGKVAMLTNWSGNTEYMTRHNCIAIDYQLTALDRDHGPYEKGQIWAAPDVEQASREMLAISRNRERATEIGLQAKHTMEEHFSPQKIGARMRKRLEVIRSFSSATQRK